MNVVRSADSFDKGICQKAELTSSVEKTCAPAS